ncbi:MULTISPECIES: hypothetical protein [unclassified Treponema]|uniref:hypothetical protein n=1 Tax=unclassified Treponema TaxID=2638727 RepID=UPI0020A2A261|nr:MULTISPECIES: hypothetical protein [unclassified Treponema]UTC65916.1 hypothetical protein E4O06_07715 [Treponema sp. OMZ 789]UTC68644.1 hypothetical protein E4O01_07855 [Treponema sp. OMZ 790]UTC71374.1 hypothetical protein E4O02_08050 [Treponema sp. OMZ 791]
MNKALNRIEYEYISDTLIREKPPLNLLCKNNFVKLDPFFYKIIGEYIFFKAEGMELNDDIKVFFNHRKRPLYFFSKVEKKDDILVFKLSDKFYKYDDELKNCKILLRNSNGFKLKADISKDFPLSFPYPPIVDDEESEKFAELRSKVSALMKMDAEKIPDAFFYRLYDISIKNNAPEFSPCLLYIDAEFILIFCTEEKSKPISVQVSAQTEIGFSCRNVDFLSVFSFFLPVMHSNQAGERCGILCLSIKNIQEEDKRFLHEKAHSSKYGYPKNEL